MHKGSRLAGLGNGRKYGALLVMAFGWQVHEQGRSLFEKSRPVSMTRTFGGRPFFAVRYIKKGFKARLREALSICPLSSCHVRWGGKGRRNKGW